MKERTSFNKGSKVFGKCRGNNLILAGQEKPIHEEMWQDHYKQGRPLHLHTDEGFSSVEIECACVVYTFKLQNMILP